MEQNAASGGKRRECGFLLSLGWPQIKLSPKQWIRWVSSNPKIQSKTKPLSQTASLQSSRDLWHRAAGTGRTGRNPSPTGPWAKWLHSRAHLFSSVEMTMMKWHNLYQSTKKMWCFLFHLAAEFLTQKALDPSSKRLLNIRSMDHPNYLSPHPKNILKYLWKYLFLYTESQQLRSKAPKNTTFCPNMLNVDRQASSWARFIRKGGEGWADFSPSFSELLSKLKRLLRGKDALQLLFKHCQNGKQLSRSVLIYTGAQDMPDIAALSPLLFVLLY